MPPLSIMIKPVSGQCNLRCDYCFYTDLVNVRKTKSYGMMTLTTLEKIIINALSFADYTCSFAFQGGEPTLAGLAFYKHLITLQAQYNIKGVQIQNSIQTNGYDLSDKFIGFLADNNFLVGVSLDGIEETHDKFRLNSSGSGTYNHVLNNIKKLELAGVDFNILCVINQVVAHKPKEIYTALMPFKYLQFIACLDGFNGIKSNYSLGENQYSTFLIETFKLYYESFFSDQYVSIRAFDNYIRILLGEAPEICSMNGRCCINYVIEANGSVFPCDFYVLDSYELGNIRYKTFFELESTVVAKNFRSASYLVHDDCMNCLWYSICRGGCRRDREPVINGKLQKNRWCSEYKKFFEACSTQLMEIATIIENGNKGR